MSLRVIAGQARGKKLKAVPGAQTRPIMDRVKEALFSILGSGVQGANFLDLFAGTGSVGIEALSRGAGFALFIEKQRGALRVIHHNLAHTGLGERAQVRRRDAFSLLKQAPVRHFDFIFVAPPQYQSMWLKTLRTLDGNPDWHNEDCTIIVQIDPAEFDDSAEFAHLQLLDRRAYGRTLLLFYCFQQRE